MAEGIIIKAMSGFYYVDGGDGALVACRGRGKLRHKKCTPLVGDRVNFTPSGDGSGMVDEILPRSNEFKRPAVANMDQLIIIASGAIPVTQPFLIDRVTSIAEGRGCPCVICINKCDLNDGDQLFEIYQKAGFPTLRISAKTGEGIAQLKGLVSGKVSAFTGNSGVGKSSILNALNADFSIPVGEVSEKLGRGRHTTRHVELFPLGEDGLAADTPGFSAFDTDGTDLQKPEAVAHSFREFVPYLEDCQFRGCSHTKEKGCAVLAALEEGIIPKSRHESYVKLYGQAKEVPEWERR